MKKYIILLLTVFLIPVHASTQTYPRTEEDLRVRDWVKVNENNKYNIMQTPSVLETEKIYDFADLLTEEQELELFTAVQDYINTYDLDLALVTTNNNYSTAEVYADDFYDYNNFGIGDKRNGLLVLIDMQNRKFHISTTGEAILMFNQNRIDAILDDMTPYMVSGDYYNAFYTSVQDIINFTSQGIPEGNKDSYIDDDGNYVYVKPKGPYPLSTFLIISAIGSTIVLVIFISKNKLVRKAYEASSYLDENNKVVNNLGDQYITSHTEHVRIVTDSSSGGGSSFSSGGSSTHTSSSGSSHGGGGRSF